MVRCCMTNYHAWSTFLLSSFSEFSRSAMARCTTIATFSVERGGHTMSPRGGHPYPRDFRCDTACETILLMPFRRFASLLLSASAKYELTLSPSCLTSNFSMHVNRRQTAKPNEWNVNNKPGEGIPRRFNSFLASLLKVRTMTGPGKTSRWRSATVVTRGRVG